MSTPRQKFTKDFVRCNTLNSGLNSTPDYTITGPATVDEGSAATFRVHAFGVKAGETLGWQVNNVSNISNGRFDAQSGTVSMLNGYQGAFEITVSADQTTAIAQQDYQVGLYWFDNINPIAESNTVIVNDSSQTPPHVNADFFWSGDQDNWYGFGTTLSSSIFSNPAPANPSYVYPDGSYTGKTRNFTGSEWMSSMNLSVGGAWQNTAITIDFWFYPTAYGIQLLSESSFPDVTTGYHYSMLEIDSNGYVHARFYDAGYPGSAIVSMLPVALNRWNHVWMTEFENGAHSFELNGIPTNGNYNHQRIKPSSEYFVIGFSDSTSLGAANGHFQGKVGWLTISDYQQAPSTFGAQRNRFRPAFVGFQSASNNGSNTVHIDSDPFNDNWLSTVPVGATIDAEGIGTFTVTGISVPTDPSNFAHNWWFSITPGTGDFPSGTRMTFSWTV